MDKKKIKRIVARGGLIIFGFMFLFAKVLLVCAVAADFKTDSVVKIFATRNTIDYKNPWQSKGVQEITGSGCIIQGNRILTNAHVVNQNTFIQVRRESSQKKYTAKVETVGNDCDLATLRVEDPEFFNGVSPLEIGELPNLQDAVTVIGFPMGGDKLSITQGVVSRMESMDYVNSNQRLLGVQIDAAINPGNSGGPAINNGKIVGIVMQLMSDSQNIGYIIPTPIINHFLKDSEDGQYAGFPYLGVHFSNTENKALRKYYGVLGDVGGVLVYSILPFSSADGFLNEGDIILEVNGVAISDDATFAFRNNERLDMVHLINMQKVGETAVLKIRREGKIIIVKVPLKPISPLVKIANHYEKPSFYIYGGLIFTVLSTDLNNALSSNDSLPPLSFAYYNLGLGAVNEKRKKEIVVLLKVLPDEINIGYHDRGYEIITKVNGKEFDSFKQFVKLIEDTQGENIVFEDEFKDKIILTCKDIDKITQDIIRRNNIPSQFSDDVAQWKKHGN
ncbi:MAG: trypsin-like peptidase domain-containing protein [Candidatus Omnitrophica bacterium]|nr:trypsin-like peptidase domain-containing protein [Candidatus Omnitrophota bacterium]MCG2707523.1 trypsin-like peptidase domain-containing protein [Candidatus Omnitrophota bacterium]